MRNKKRKIYGVGVNDYEGVVRSQGETMYEYVVWSDMIRRCYSVKERSRLPTYAGCQAEPFFHYFTNFLNFIKTLKGYKTKDEFGRRFHLDKDLLFKGNKLYSRNTVCLLPPEVNAFLTKSTSTRGKCMIGVSYHKRVHKFTAQFSYDGKLVHLGCYDSEKEAHLAYKTAKENRAKELAEKWKHTIDERAYEALMSYTVYTSD